MRSGLVDDELQVFTLRKVIPVFIPEGDEYERRLKEEVVLNAYRCGYYLPSAPTVTTLPRAEFTPDGYKVIEIRCLGRPLVNQ